MRALFVRDIERPLDSLNIGRIKEREKKKKLVELKRAANILITDLKLEPDTLEVHEDIETVSVSFQGIKRTVDDNKHEVIYFIGWDTGKVNTYYVGYEDLFNDETSTSHQETLGECMGKIRWWLS